MQLWQQYLVDFDHWLLFVINSWVASSPASFQRAVEQSDRLSWLLAAMAIAGIWFYGEKGKMSTEIGQVTRLDNRRRVLLTLGTLVSSFLIARMVQIFIERSRPIANAVINVPIELHTWEKVKQGLELQGSFPSDHAAMFMIITMAVWKVNWRAGIFVLGVNLYFSALRIGIGYHWPVDILAGAMVAWLIFTTAFLIEPWLAKILDSLLLQFEYKPRLLFPLAFLFLFDLSQRFTGLFALIDKVGNVIH